MPALFRSIRDFLARKEEAPWPITLSTAALTCVAIGFLSALAMSS